MPYFTVGEAEAQRLSTCPRTQQLSDRAEMGTHCPYQPGDCFCFVLCQGKDPKPAGRGGRGVSGEPWTGSAFAAVLESSRPSRTFLLTWN